LQREWSVPSATNPAQIACCKAIPGVTTVYWASKKYGEFIYSAECKEDKTWNTEIESPSSLLSAEFQIPAAL